MKKVISNILPFRPLLIRRSSKGELYVRSAKAEENSFPTATATPYPDKS